MLAEVMLHFGRPVLLTLAAMAAAPWLIAWRGRRHGRYVPWRSVAVQSLAMLVVAMALGEPEVPGRPGGPLPVDVMVDASASQARLPERLPADVLDDLPRDDYIFADTIGRPGQALNTQRTNLDPVFSLLASRAKQRSAAVIITDGRMTDGDVARAAAHELAANGPHVFFVPRAPLEPDARVADLSVRRVGQTGRAELTATAVATAPLRVKLRITRHSLGSATPVGEASLQLLEGQPQTTRWSDDLPPDAHAIYRAELFKADPEGTAAAQSSAASSSLPLDDLLADNNAMTALAPMPMASTVLWATDWPPSPDLGGEHFTVTPTATADMPHSVDQLLTYSAVFVSDAAGRVLGKEQRAALGEFVRLGGGLVFAGAGPHSTPADRDDPLNQVLPLVASPYERKTLDVTVLLDASGSMGQVPTATSPSAGTAPGVPKFEIARQATLAMARRQLVPGDYLTVYTFKTAVAQRYAGPATREGLNELERALAAVPVGGGTRIIPALEAALETKREGTRERLVIVLSDLQTEDFDPTAWARRMADAHMALAVVVTGQPDEKAPLKLLAGQLDAPFIHRDDLGGLAEVFMQFLRQARGDVLVRELAKVSVQGPLFDTQVASLPDADDWVAAVAQEKAEVLASTAGGQPLIARWRAEAGRSVCLALPIQNPHNRRWRSSTDVSSVLTAAIRWVAASPGDARFFGRVQRGEGRIRLTISAEDGEYPINLLMLQANVKAVEEAPHIIDLLQIAPGEYQADLPDWGATPAMVHVRLLERSGDAGSSADEGRVVWRQAFPGRYADELARLGVDEPAIQELAALTGGQVISADELPGKIKALPQLQTVHLWPYLLGLALALVLVDWVTTRLVRKT